MPKPKPKQKSKASAAKRRRPKVAAAPSLPLLLPTQAASLIKPKRTRRRKPAARQSQPSFWERWGKRGLALACTMVALILAIGLALDIHGLQGSGYALSETAPHRDTVATKQLRVLSDQVSALESAEEGADVQVAPATDLEQQLSQIQIEIQVGSHREAVAAMDRLAKQVSAYRAKLTSISLGALKSATGDGGLNVPILVYHQTPADFGSQLGVLEQKGYHTITMAQLAAALHSQSSLPPKPVIITFDDGFANQMTAFGMLQQHHMVATYYIIDGGPGSRWCIGANRRYNDPAQPPGGCGDAYLNWNQVRQLDRSGIITIGSHTIDHPDLATESPAQQQYEIAQGKQQLEAQLGHKVYDFAYPYGSFNATTLAIVQQAGFATAVTTTPGTDQSLSTIYTLRRVRDPRQLP